MNDLKIGGYYRILDNEYNWSSDKVGVYTGESQEGVLSFRLADMSKKEIKTSELTEPKHTRDGVELPKHSIKPTDKGSYLEAIGEALDSAWDHYRDALKRRDALMKYAQREETNDTIKKIINYIKSLNK